MTADRDQATRDRLAEALDTHQFTGVNSSGWTTCLCGWTAETEGDDDDGSFARHESDALLPVVADLVREGQAEALEDMAVAFEADAKHLVGGAVYAQAADDCRTEAAAFRAPRTGAPS